MPEYDKPQELALIYMLPTRIALTLKCELELRAVQHQLELRYPTVCFLKETKPTPQLRQRTNREVVVLTISPD